MLRRFGRHVLPAAAGALCALVFTACTPRENLSRTEVDLLGTVCTITLYGSGTQGDLDAAFRRLREIEDRMTIRRASELTRVNAASGSHAVSVHPDTFSVIREGLKFSRIGDGAFDITVGPLVALWGIGTDKARIPSSAEIKGALSRIDYRSVELLPADNAVFLKKPGMAIDLGAIAKGYAADEAAQLLRQRGVKHALINLGGNVLTLGLKPDGSRWRIGIQDPEKTRGDHIGVVTVGEMAVVTSGVYERYFDSGGARYHHILDTKTGFPVRNGLLAVSILTRRSVEADGFSTLVFALGLEKGRRLVESMGGDVNAIFITEDHGVYMTAGLRGVFTLQDTRYTLKGW